jgi:tRNA-splicing ligase RtcB (3'-phosphate/5'-hydroxy nucleic acid ligase)
MRHHFPVFKSETGPGEVCAFIMGNQKLTIKDISTIDFPSEVAKSLALNIANRSFKHFSIEDKKTMIGDVLENPINYRTHDSWSVLALKLLAETLTDTFDSFELEDVAARFEVFGSKHIELNAIRQMEIAMRLPVSRKGALMPDAHQGFGLPIGGVLATENSLIPYAVGMDIGCRMALSILEIPSSYLEQNVYKIKQALKTETHFGNEGGLDRTQDHEVLQHSDFMATDLLRRLHGKAMRQLGTSGSGNHFVEFGTVQLGEGNVFRIPAGVYCGILSHSGSRSLGANIAEHYTKIAMSRCRLPREARALAWLDLDSEAGMEYWLSMQLAGEYAKACHDRIHDNLCQRFGLAVLAKVENHHNFAWKEKFGDYEYIVHRKGATPAAAGILGIIPGSMTAPGFIVRGAGNAMALNSAAHGAGRLFSRQRARESMTASALKKMLQREKIELLGGSVEEGPHAYKDIELIMKSQSTLVTIEGTFHPKIVRMAND